MKKYKRRNVEDDTLLNYSQESPNGSLEEPNGVSNRKIHPGNHGQRKKDGNSLLGNHLDSRSKGGEDNLQENMPMDVDNHVDDFCLSNEIIGLGMSEKNLGKIVPISTIKAEAVLTFIRLLKQELVFKKPLLQNSNIREIIDKLAGDKFNG